MLPLPSWGLCRSRYLDAAPLFTTLEAHYMMKKALLVLAFSGVAASAQAGALINEGFDNVGDLAGKGWVIDNAGTPGGLTPAWYQGDQTIFPAQGGAAESYLASNYNNAPVGGELSSWLITPEFSTAMNVIVSFWLRADALAGYSDQIAFGFSNGSTSLTDFTLEPAFTVPTGEWTLYKAHIGPQGAGSTARFALQYTGAADAANYVGVDTLAVNAVPEPASMLILAGGLAALTAARRRRSS
ncbi:MAG TPA: hypothetical protein DDX04_10190 [Massilia sp.]|nr:hypothetical protein [Massilia sp.]